MIQKRTDHGCVKVLLGDKSILWVTGGDGGPEALYGSLENKGLLKTTEFLDLDNLDQGWQQGLDILDESQFLLDHRMVTSEDMRTAYIIGGKERWTGGEDNEPIKENGVILEMKCQDTSPGTCEFKASESKMRIYRESHVAFPISNQIAAELCSS